MVTSAYKSLVEAASQLADIDFFDDVNASNIDEASILLHDVRNSLDSIRQMLNHVCEVSVHYDSSFISNHMDDLQHLRNLSRAFRMESDVASWNGDYHSVGRIGTDTLKLANHVRRGGLVVDLLVGIAISGVAMESLRRNRDHFDELTRCELIIALQRLENEREPFVDIVNRDREWEAVAGCEHEPCDFTDKYLQDPQERGLSEKEQKELLQIVQSIAELPESDQRTMQLDQDRHMLALMRMLTVDLALRSWHVASRSFPADLALLVPQHLPSLPLDPFTDSSFIYRPFEDDSFHLYSTGPKGFDAGGDFGAWPHVADGCADLCLDANDFWSDCCSVPEHDGAITRFVFALRSWWRQINATEQPDAPERD